MDNAAPYSMINGRIIPAPEAALQVNDLALQRGYGIFDFFKTVNGHPVFVTDHLNRFLYSATEMRLNSGLSMQDLEQQIHTLQTSNQLPESGIRLTLTGGYAPDGYSVTTPNLILTQIPLTLPRDLPQTIQLMTHEFQRQLPAVKSIDYLMAIWLQPQLKKQAMDDVLYISAGVVRECPRANFFIINNKGELQTTKEKVLWGITRKKVLELAGKILPVTEKDITLVDLAGAREAFITSTTKHITPVKAVDGLPVGNSEPGELTQLLSERLLHLVFAEH